MSTFENLYLYTGRQAVEAVASRLAEALSAEVVHARGQVIVKRPMADVPEGWVRGQVAENMFYENPPSQDNPSITDLYDISWDVWCTPRPDEFQRSEAALIFTQIIEKLDWPVVLIHNETELISAWAPTLGRTDFVSGTTADEEHQELWRPYADPAAIAGQG